MASVAPTPTKRKRDENDPPAADINIPPSRIPRIAAKRVSTVRDPLRTPLSNKTNAMDDGKTGPAKKHTDLKTPLQAKSVLKDNQNKPRMPKIAQSAVAVRTAKPLEQRASLRPAQKLNLPAQTPQPQSKVPLNAEEKLPAPRSISSLIEQAGFEERCKALEEEFARKNKEAEDLWNQKAEELQVKLEEAKQERELAAKAQIDMAALLTEQRDKYEEAMNKLCDELAEARAKITQLTEQQQAPMPSESEQALPPQPSQSSSPAEPSPEVIQMVRQQVEAECVEKLQSLEADWNELLATMEGQMNQVKAQEEEAMRKHNETVAQMSMEQGKYQAMVAQLQEELAQAQVRLQAMEAAAQTDRAKEELDREDQLRDMQVEYEKKTAEREAEWSAKLDGLREQMDVEKQQSLTEQERLHAAALHDMEIQLTAKVEGLQQQLELVKQEADVEKQQALTEQERQHAAAAQEREAHWTGKVEAMQQEVDLAKQAEQEAFKAQREIATLLSQGQQKHELELQKVEQQWAAKCEELRQQLEAAQRTGTGLVEEEKAKYEQLVSSLQEALAVEREQRKKENERASLLENGVGSWLDQLSSNLAKEREARVKARQATLAS